MTITPSTLSALALAQLRLDVEAAHQQAGSRTSAPADYRFFDPFELSEEMLQERMVSIGRADEFDEMRKQAEARFPDTQSGVDDLHESIERDKATYWLGMKGLIARAALWGEAEQKMSSADLEQYAAAVDLPAGSQERVAIEKLAKRWDKIASFGVSELSYWILFAVLEHWDEEQIDSLIGLAGDMGPMLANELLPALAAETLDARLKRKAESGGQPQFAYRITSPGSI